MATWRVFSPPLTLRPELGPSLASALPVKAVALLPESAVLGPSAIDDDNPVTGEVVAFEAAALLAIASTVRSDVPAGAGVRGTGGVYTEDSILGPSVAEAAVGAGAATAAPAGARAGWAGPGAGAEPGPLAGLGP